jgi:hypothetical protein
MATQNGAASLTVDLTGLNGRDHRLSTLKAPAGPTPDIQAQRK